MASILKGPSGGGFRWNNFMVITVLLAVVVGLFLIPEFAGWSGRPSGKTDEITQSDGDELDILEKKYAQEDRQSPLDKFIAMLDSEGGLKTAEPEKAGKGENRLDTLLGEKKKAEEELPGFGAANGPLTWKDLHSGTAIDSMKKAQRQTLALAKSLGLDYPESRFALFNYSGGLARVVQGNEKTMSAAEAVMYIDGLDKAVTEAMLRERVERSDFLRWADVSLGPLTSGAGAAALKKKWAPAFRPLIFLTSIKVMQPPGSYGRWIPGGRAFVSGRGYAVGKDINRLFLWRSDGAQRRLPLYKADARGRRLFKIPRSDAHYHYAIVASDKSGAEYRKFYEFYSRARAFIWNRKSGYFRLPFADNDPRLDVYFHVAGPADRRGSGNLFGGSRSESQLQAF